MGCTRKLVKDLSEGVNNRKEFVGVGGTKLEQEPTVLADCCAEVVSQGSGI